VIEALVPGAREIKVNPVAFKINLSASKETGKKTNKTKKQTKIAKERKEERDTLLRGTHSRSHH
jgi:hypothetical protein